MGRQGQQRDLGGEVEDVVKSAMGPYFVLPASSSFFLCALGAIHHFEKRMLDALTKIEVQLCTHWVCSRH